MSGGKSPHEIFDILQQDKLYRAKQESAESMVVPFCFPSFLGGEDIGAGEKAKVSKGAWRMPWLTEATKDVISCEKWRVGANIL